MMEASKSNIFDILLSIVAFLCMCIGIPLALPGLTWFIADIIAIITGGGGNLTGVGLIVGPMYASPGFALIFLPMAFLYYRGKKIIKEGKIPLISVMVIKKFSIVCIGALAAG